jgi:hypothetical protein
MEEDDQKSNRALIVIAVIILIAIIIVYCLSLGLINFAKQDDEKEKRLRWIDERLKDLHVEAKSKEELKEQLNKKVRKYFLLARILLSFLYLALNAGGIMCLMKFEHDFHESLSIALNYNEALLLLVLVGLFIRFESHSEFKDVFKIIHLSITERVYRGHQELENEIAQLNTEIELLSNERDVLVNGDHELPIEENQ